MKVGYRARAGYQNSTYVEERYKILYDESAEA